MGMKVGDISGQMTVEFVIAFPVMFLIGIIAINALLLFSECAAFDRIAKEAVRIHASSPAYGQTLEQSCEAIEQEIAGHFEKEYLNSSLSFSQDISGHVQFIATLRFSPTLFGMGLRSEVLGVALPQLKHSTSIVIDSYRPGVLI